MTEAIRLDGCNPEPLMGYLKALGVLRLVSEQKDPNARGYWRDGIFLLETPIGRQGLAEFFLSAYSPTPLLAPWNGGSGFYIKLDLDAFLESGGNDIEFKGREAVDAIHAVEDSKSERLARYRNQIRETKKALAALAEQVDFKMALAGPLQQWHLGTGKAAQKKAKEEATKILNTMLLFRSGEGIFSIGKAAKDEFVSDLRGKVLTDDGLFWLDAALAMRTGQKKNRVEAPTLGSGGNIGNSDFSARFAQLLPEILSLDSASPTPLNSPDWLGAALFGAPAPGLQKLSVDQFDPGKAGGANGTQGLEASPTLNPWDYLLMMEGALALAGNTSRRLGAGRAAASFPFVVESTSAGYGSAGRDNTRGEAWLPLWSAPALFKEVQSLLAEGRAEVGRVRAWSGLTFAQAVAGLGVDRGIQTFVRYEFQERLGQSYIATPIGRFDVPRAPLPGIELVRALNPLLYALQSVAAEGKAPARFASAVRRIESSIFDFCKYGGDTRLAAILASLGNAERELSVGNASPDRRRVKRPLAGLHSGWLRAANDGSHEFNLARSAAFLNPGLKTGQIRRNLEPVERTRFGWEWGDGGGHVVWADGNLGRNLGAVLIRRLQDAEKNGEPRLPFGSPFLASLAAVEAFLRGDVNDSKFEDLIWGLSLVERSDEWEVPPPEENTALPRAFALLKLALLPKPLEGTDAGMTPIKPEPAALAKLRAGDVAGACELAARRLRASGFSVIGGFAADGRRRPIDWSAGGVAPERLLGALLFPVPDHAANRLADLVLRRPSVGNPV